MDFCSVFVVFGYVLFCFVNFVCGTFFHPHHGPPLGFAHRKFHEMTRTPCPPSDWDYRGGPIHVRGPIPFLHKKPLNPHHVKIIPRKIIHYKPPVFPHLRFVPKKVIRRKPIKMISRKRLHLRVHKDHSTKKLLRKYPRWALPWLPRSGVGRDTTFIQRFIKRHNEQRWHDLNLWILKNQNGGYGVTTLDGQFPRTAFVPDAVRTQTQKRRPLIRDGPVDNFDTFKPKQIDNLPKPDLSELGVLEKPPVLLPIFFKFKSKMETPRPMPVIPNIDTGLSTTPSTNVGVPSIPNFSVNVDNFITTPANHWERNGINGILTFDPTFVPPAGKFDPNPLEIGLSDPMLQTLNLDNFRTSGENHSAIPPPIYNIPIDTPLSGRVDSLDAFPFPDLGMDPGIVGLPLPPTSNKQKETIIAKPLEPFGPGKPVANRTFLGKGSYVVLPSPITKNPDGGNLDIIIPDSLLADLGGDPLASDFGSNKSDNSSHLGNSRDDVFIPTPLSNIKVTGHHVHPPLFPSGIDFRKVFIPNPVAFSEKSDLVAVPFPSKEEIMREVFIPIPIMTTPVPTTPTEMTTTQTTPIPIEEDFDNSPVIIPDLSDSYKEGTTQSTTSTQLTSRMTSPITTTSQTATSTTPITTTVPQTTTVTTTTPEPTTVPLTTTEKTTITTHLITTTPSTTTTTIPPTTTTTTPTTSTTQQTSTTVPTTTPQSSTTQMTTPTTTLQTTTPVTVRITTTPQTTTTTPFTTTTTQTTTVTTPMSTTTPQTTTTMTTPTASTTPQTTSTTVGTTISTSTTTITTTTQLTTSQPTTETTSTTVTTPFTTTSKTTTTPTQGTPATSTLTTTVTDTPIETSSSGTTLIDVLTSSSPLQITNITTYENTTLTAENSSNVLASNDSSTTTEVTPVEESCHTR